MTSSSATTGGRRAASQAASSKILSYALLEGEDQDTPILRTSSRRKSHTSSNPTINQENIEPLKTSELKGLSNSKGKLPISAGSIALDTIATSTLSNTSILAQGSAAAALSASKTVISSTLKPAQEPTSSFQPKGCPILPSSVSMYQLRRIIKENHGQAINYITFSPLSASQNILVTVGGNQVNFYDNEHGADDHLDILSQFTVAEDMILTHGCFLHSPADVVFAVTGPSSIIHVISLARSEELCVLNEPRSASTADSGVDMPIAAQQTNIIALASQPSKPNTLASLSAKELVIWGVKDLRRQTIVAPAKVSFSSMAWNQDGFLLVGCTNGSFWSLDANTIDGTEAELSLVCNSSTSIHGNNAIKSISFLGKYSSAPTDEDAMDIQPEDDTRVLSRSYDGRIVLWNLYDLHVMISFSVSGGSGGRYWSLFEGKFLALPTPSGSIRIYSLSAEDGGKLLGECVHYRCRKSLNAVAFSAHGNCIVGAGDDGIIWRFDLRKPNLTPPSDDAIDTKEVVME